MHHVDNPYQRPSSDVEVLLPNELVFEPAGKGRRFLNLLIDYLGFACLGIVLIIAGSFFLDEGFAHQIERMPDYFLGAVLMLLYYVPLEMAFGRTLGKLITGTRVVTVQDQHPTWKQIVIRSLSRVVPFEPFSLLMSGDGAWHDQWSGTKVVRTRKSL